MAVGQCRAYRLVLLVVHLVVARAGLAPRIVETGSIAAVGLVIVGRGGLSDEFHRVVQGRYVLGGAVLMEDYVEYVGHGHLGLSGRLDIGVGTIFELIDHLAGAGEHGIGILAQRLIPYGNVALLIVEQVGDFAACILFNACATAVIVILCGSLSALVAVCGQGRGLAVQHEVGVVCEAVAHHRGLHRCQIAYEGTDSRGGYLDNGHVVEREVHHATVLDGTRAEASYECTAGYGLRAVVVDGHILETQIAQCTVQQ